MARNIVSFVGCDRPTKVHRLTQAIAARLEAEDDVSVTHLDLSHAGSNLFTVNRKALDRQSESLISEIEHCDALIVGCPVYQEAIPVFSNTCSISSIRSRCAVARPCCAQWAAGIVMRWSLNIICVRSSAFRSGNRRNGHLCLFGGPGTGWASAPALEARIDSAVDQMKKQLVQSHQASGIRWKDVELLEQF